MRQRARARDVGPPSVRYVLGSRALPALGSKDWHEKLLDQCLTRSRFAGTEPSCDVQEAELPNDAPYWAARLMAPTSQCNLLGNNPSDAPVVIGSLIEAAKGAGHQIAAFEALGALGGDAAITFLIEASKSQDTSTAESATQALIYAYNKACGTSVLITGLKHPNPNVREQAFLFLGVRAGTLTDKKPVAEALERSLKDPSYAVREMCARALGIFGDRTVAPALVEVFRSKLEP